MEEGLSNVAYFRTDGGSSKLYTQEYVDKQNEEIERLNNIIDELEKYICDLEIECNIDSSMWGVAVIIHNKLKELKGSDKE